MKRLLLILALVGLACSGTTLVSTGTAPAVQPGPTSIPATALPLPAHTVLPTALPAPTAVLPPTATPPPPAIGPQNAAQVNQLGEMPSPALRRVVFAPDGKTFATAAGNDGNYGVKTWNSQGGALIQSYPGYTGIVWDLAYSPNGEWLATAADDAGGQTVRIWNAAQGTQAIALTGPRQAISVAFSPDGKRLAVGGTSGGQGSIWIFDTTSWARVQLLPASGQNVGGLVFMPDGNHLIGSGTDGKIRLWSLPDGVELKTLFHGIQANHLALSPDGSLLASSHCDNTATNGCSKGGVSIWRTSDWAIVQQFPDLAESLAFSSDGSLLITGSGPNDPLVRIRHTSDWALLRTLAAQSFSLVLSPDRRELVSISFDKVSLWGVK